MADTRYSLLEALPDELLHDESKAGVARYLTMPTLSRFARTSHRLHSLFQPGINTIRAAKLLEYVINADYDAAEKIVTVMPALMFMAVSTHEIISPLQYAFKVYDTYMWKMFMEKIKHDPENRERFREQENQQKDHINLGPLLAEYENYLKFYRCWLVRQITNKELDVLWRKIGDMQRQYLPWAMLKEFCRRGETWAKMNFNTEIIPRPLTCQVYNYSTHSSVSLTPSCSLDGSLMRGPLAKTCADRVGCYADLAAIDMKVFCRLVEVRKAELAQVSQLLSASQAMDVSHTIVYST